MNAIVQSRGVSDTVTELIFAPPTPTAISCGITAVRVGVEFCAFVRAGAGAAAERAARTDPGHRSARQPGSTPRPGAGGAQPAVTLVTAGFKTLIIVLFLECTIEPVASACFPVAPPFPMTGTRGRTFAASSSCWRKTGCCLRLR